MTTERERYLLTRCLRLELQVAVLKGLEVARAAIERRSLYDDAPPPVVTFKHDKRKIQHRTTDADIAQMRKLKRRGLSNTQVARHVEFSECTVRRYTKDVLMEREVHAT